MKMRTALAAAAVFSISTIAMASVSIDFSTGAGFVGKGDVQLAYGWNNAQLQNKAGDVGFYAQSSADYDAVCVWTTGTGTRGQHTHHVTHTTTSNLKDSIAYDARVKTQITGFNLRGFVLGSTVESGDPIPVLGGPCPGNEGTDGVWESVDGPMNVTNSLFVTYKGGNDVQLL